ncbi:DnaJ domain-containing protein [Coemansia spiralis]|nr:DnaJ domain-containing protein [Coemansia spiralis]
MGCTLARRLLTWSLTRQRLHPPQSLASCRCRRSHSWHDASHMFSRLRGNAYQTLGVEADCTADEIKAKYYKLCRQLHPDTCSADRSRPSVLDIGDAEWQRMGAEERRRVMHDRFVSVTSAYEVLSSPEMRRQYNIYARAEHGRRAGADRQGNGDPWASERPYGQYRRRQTVTQEERLNNRRLTIGVFGFLSVLIIVSAYQRHLQYEDQKRLIELKHQRATHVLDGARERARERALEVPPEHAMEYEARRLRAAAGQTGDGFIDGAYEKLWPHGSGLGLIALLDEQQLCGIESRQRAASISASASDSAADPELARGRASARRALMSDRIVGRYLLQQPQNNDTRGIDGGR